MQDINRVLMTYTVYTVQWDVNPQDISRIPMTSTQGDVIMQDMTSTGSS